MDEHIYAAWKDKNADKRKREVRIDEIVIAPLERVHPEYVARQIEQKKGEI